MEINIDDIKGIARLAGQETLKFYNKNYDVSYKSPKEPLTEADLASDRIIKAGLEKYGIPILSEETEDDKSRLKSEYVWIVDPLDGTSDFVEKTNEFSIIISLVRKGEPILGVVYEPTQNRFYFAEKGKGAFTEEAGKIKKILVSDKNNFQEMKILLSRNHLLESEVVFCEKTCVVKVNMGSAGLKMGRIAEGKAEIYINSSDKTSEWDTCAGNIIVLEAGGMVTDLEGENLRYNKENTKHLRGFLVSNGKNHKRILKELGEIME